MHQQCFTFAVLAGYLVVPPMLANWQCIGVILILIFTGPEAKEDRPLWSVPGPPSAQQTARPASAGHQQQVRRSTTFSCASMQQPSSGLRMLFSHVAYVEGFVGIS